MFDISNKSDTLRQATAQAIVKASSTTITLIKDGKSPKGSIVDAARLAATMATKRTSDLIPYCHPIPIDHVKVDVSIKEESIEVAVQVKSIWHTGVEMESLTGAAIASLTIYDMLKPIDESLSIESIRLIEKKGGKKDFYENYSRRLKAAVLVTSDSRGKKEDQSGKVVINKLKKEFDIADYKVIPNNTNIICSEIIRFCDELKVDIVITSGGTGVGPHDNTPDATKKIIDKEVIGVSEMIRAYGQKRTPLSMLSRGLVGVRGNTLIINLPGSVRAVSESLDSLFPGILHIFKMLWGHTH